MSIAMNEFPQHTSVDANDTFIISGTSEEARVTFDAMVNAMGSAISANVQSGVPPVATFASDLDYTESTVWLYAGETTENYTNGYIYYWLGEAWAQGSYYGAAETATTAEVTSIVDIIEGT